MASVNYDKCLETILHHEGGYVNHPKDPGGETNLGVTKRVYEDWGGTKDMKDLLVEDAEIKLLRSLEKIKNTIGPMLLEANYSLALQSLVELRRDIDEFFTDVLVNCEEKEIQENRIAILWQLRSLFSTVADISLMHGN